MTAERKNLCLRTIHTLTIQFIFTIAQKQKY